MKRVFGLFIVLTCLGSSLSAQTSWKGQAEVWSSSSGALDGFYAASDQFQKNAVLIVESYKTHKTVQVRVTSSLPPGSASLVLLSPKAASALGMVSGDSVPVSVQIDTSLEGYLASGGDRTWNPDPDVTPLPSAAPNPTATTSVPQATEDNGSTTPLPVENGLPSDSVSTTPGSHVFLAAPTSTPDGSTEPSEPAAAAEKESTPAAPTAETVQASPPVAEASPASVPQSSGPLPEIGVIKQLPNETWVSKPSLLQGPVLGNVRRVDSLKGEPYLRLASFTKEKDLMDALKSVRSYVPLTVITGGTGKESFILAASAPKNQLGVLLLLFRDQGYRTAYVVKG